jgi:excinuclease ABC subunit A
LRGGVNVRHGGMVADSPDVSRLPLIRVRGAREHNLRAIDLDLDPHAITVLVGRSGSGKSSLALDTLHAESSRRLLGVMAGRGRHALPALPRPDVDALLDLPTTLALEARRHPPRAGATVASRTECDLVLRVLFGRAAVPHDPVTGAPLRVMRHDEIVGRLAALPEGARVSLEAPVRGGRAALDEITRAGFSRVRWRGNVVRLDELAPAQVGEDEPLRVVVDRVRVASDRLDRLHDAVRTTSRAGQGRVIAVLDDGELEMADLPWSEGLQRALADLSPGLFRVGGGDEPCEACQGRSDPACAVCGGHGLGVTARAARLGAWTWASIHGAPIREVLAGLAELPAGPVVDPLRAELGRRLTALVEGGCGALTLGRALGTLSSGELQKVRLAGHASGDLAGVLHVLDEPSGGLDDAGAAEVVALLYRLRAAGCGLVVVDHHPTVIAAADRVIEFGPGVGAQGGQVVFDGPPDALRGANTLTGAWLRGERAGPSPGGAGAGAVTLRGIPRGAAAGGAVALVAGALNVLVGPTGAGKTAALAHLARVVQARIDQADPDVAGLVTGLDGVSRLVWVDDEAAGRSRRSSPATYTGLWDTVRELLSSTQEARVRGLESGRFSLAVRGGRCEACRGLGVVEVDLGFLPDVLVPCEVCGGKRFAGDVLAVRYKGMNAGQVLDLTVDEARAQLAGHPRIDDALRALAEVGLGHVRLGQPADTLSGGEAWRLRLARELVRALRGTGADTLFLVDEPAAGLHPEDVAVLARLFRALVAQGSTVVAATHHPVLRAAADHLVDLGAAVSDARGC